MYGKIVEYNGYKFFINCVPSTPNSELMEKAKRKYERYLRLSGGVIKDLNLN